MKACVIWFFANISISFTSTVSRGGNCSAGSCLMPDGIDSATLLQKTWQPGGSSTVTTGGGGRGSPSRRRYNPNSGPCTAEDQDVYSTGSELACCAGLSKKLEDCRDRNDKCWYCKSDGSTPRRRSSPPRRRSPNSGGSGSFTAVSYNMQWHEEHGKSGSGSVFGALQRELPFDIVGFQETDDVQKVIRDSGLGSFEGYHSGPPIAWNTGTFDRIAGPGRTEVGSDKWGKRYHSWVRLRHRSSGKNVLFTNTHGQWPRCPHSEGQKWVDVLRRNSQDDDVVLMAGDFNCEFSNSALKTVMSYFNCHRDRPNFDKNQNPTCVASAPGHQSGIDHIFVKGGTIGGPFWFEGHPSDHNGVKGRISW